MTEVEEIIRHMLGQRERWLRTQLRASNMGLLDFINHYHLEVSPPQFRHEEDGSVVVFEQIRLVPRD